MVAYVIASELGPSSTRGSEALASAVSALAAELLAGPARRDPETTRNFHGIAAQRLRSLGLLARGESFQAELARVGQAMRETIFSPSGAPLQP